MSLRIWLLFCATDTVLCLTPGPAVLLVVSQAMSRGMWSGLAASLGILATNAVYFALSATGVGALLVGSSRVFIVVKWLGAIYLVWMGARMILAKRAAVQRPETAPETSTRSAFSLGVVTQGANPKAIGDLFVGVERRLGPGAAARTGVHGEIVIAAAVEE